MKRHITVFLQGLLVTAPVLATLWVLVASVSGLDVTFRELLGFGVASRIPGAGIILAVVITYVSGLLTHAYIFRALLRVAEEAINRVPLVKTLYGSIRDMLAFFQSRDRLQGQAVTLTLDERAHMIGIATTRDAGSDRVGVYLPLSYQIGGFLVYVPKDRLGPLDMDVESALKLVLTGGLGVSTPPLRHEAAEEPPAPPETA